MTKILVLISTCFVLESVHGIWNDFRVTYNVNPLGHFNRMPKTLSEANEEGWKNISTSCDNSGSYFGFRHLIPDDNSIVLLYDVNGIIAGMQILLAHEEVLSANNTFRYGEVAYFNNETFNGTDHFVITAYFVEPEIICTTGRTEEELLTNGTGQGVWIQNGTNPSSLLEIPMIRENALNSGWSDNNCFPGMGTHSWYMMEDYEESNCDIQTPAFGMWNRAHELHGFGFAAPGLAQNPRYEHPPSAMISIVIGPIAPQCLHDQRNAIGTTNLHVYFVDNPWLVTC